MTNNAICPFCGQAFMLREELTEEQAKKYALSVCDCGSARQLRVKENQIQQAQVKLAEIFSFSFNGSDGTTGQETDGNLLEILYKLIEETVNDNVLSVDMKIPGIGKLSIKSAGDGKIKIKKSLTFSYGSEV